jgi:outer membrane protein insertion porin family/translocation and assembly module TamA
VEIAGNESVSARVIERQVTYKPGDLYRRSVVQDTQRRLYGMELFQFVNVEALNPEQRDPEVRTRITVAEGKHQRVNFGVGYGTEEHGRVDGEYHHVNFLGAARSAGAHARYSSLDRGLRIDFNQPYFFTPHNSLGGEAVQWYTYTPAYRSVVSGGKAMLTHKQSPQLSWAVSMTSERNTSTITALVRDDPTLRDDLIALGLDPDTLEQRGTLNAVGFDLQHSTADNLLNASRGYQVAFHAEAAGKYLPGTYNYTAVSVDGRHYLPLTDRLIVANRVQLGNINAAGDDPSQVPFAKKYFLGGAGNVRGWGRYEVSPLSRSGLPIGGNTLFAFSSEARMTLRGNFGGVLFVDGGNVWADDWTIKVGDLRYAIGPGLRYQTPIGPVRFDIGYQLNPIEGLIIDGAEQKRRWRVHFSIGQAF